MQRLQALLFTFLIGFIAGVGITVTLTYSARESTAISGAVAVSSSPSKSGPNSIANSMYGDCSLCPCAHGRNTGGSDSGSSSEDKDSAKKEQEQVKEDGKDKNEESSQLTRDMRLCDEAQSEGLVVGQYPSKCPPNVAPPLRTGTLDVVLLATPMVINGKLRLMDKIAMKSWDLLDPRPKDIVIFGAESVVKEYCEETGFTWSNVSVNEFGTPFMDDIYSRGEKLSKAAVVAYVNADLLLFNDFLHAVERVNNKFGSEWFAAGRRYDVPVAWNKNEGDGELVDGLYDRMLSPSAREDRSWEHDIRKLACSETVADSKFGHGTETDYFIWPRGLWARHGQTVPPFLIGRYFWGEWHLKVAAHVIKVPTIDISISALVLHNKHKHIQWNEGATNPEQRYNSDLADRSLGDWSGGVTEILQYGSEDVVRNSEGKPTIATATEVNAEGEKDGSGSGSVVCLLRKQ